jgi:hypothetical protein
MRSAARALAALLGLALAAGLAGAGLVAHRLFLDRSAVPDLEPFLRFEAPLPPEIGRAYDTTGQLLVDLANAHRVVVHPEEFPPVCGPGSSARQAQRPTPDRRQGPAASRAPEGAPPPRGGHHLA